MTIVVPLKPERQPEIQNLVVGDNAIVKATRLLQGNATRDAIIDALLTTKAGRKGPTLLIHNNHQTGRTPSEQVNKRVVRGDGVVVAEKGQRGAALSGSKPLTI